MRSLVLVLSIALLSGCAFKQKILDATAVSMSKRSLKKGQKTKEVGTVTGEFCAEMSKSGTFGLMDEAIKDAQRKSKVDFITHVTFYSTGKCVSLEGTGVKVIK